MDVQEIRNAYKILVGNSEGNRPRGRSDRRWENNIKTYVKKWDIMLWAGFDWLMTGSRGGLFISFS
jgi:hypothetical protein